MTDTGYTVAVEQALANPDLPLIWRERLTNGETPPVELLAALSTYNPDGHRVEAINRRQQGEHEHRIADDGSSSQVPPLLLRGPVPSAYEVITREGVVPALWQLMEELANDEEQLAEAIEFGTREEQEALIPLMERLRRRKASEQA